jgi:hypothetical protein
VAVGRTACATTGEREAPLRSRLARTRRPRVAAACRPGPRHRPHGRGGRDGRALGRRRLALQVLFADVPVQVVAGSEQQATGHALHGHRWLLSQHRAPRRLHAAPAETVAQGSRIDQLRACSKGASVLRLAEPSGRAPGILDPQPARSVRRRSSSGMLMASAVLAGQNWVRRPTGDCQRDCHHRAS